MALTNTQIGYYDSNVLRLPADKRTAYHAQVDNLIAELRRSLHGTTDLRITQVVKAGSFAKYTILRRTTADPVDVDVVFYLAGHNLDRETLASLTNTIEALLVAMYPTKSVEDFTIQRKAATVAFVGSGLSVDVVPVIEDPRRPGYGWQFDIQDSTRVQTCAPCQIQFVRDHKAKDAHFRTLVRLAKKWRNHADLTPLRSFVIELILASLVDREGTDGSIEQRFRRFLMYLWQSGLQEEIRFPHNSAPCGAFAGPVVIVDPVCSTNNVAGRITEAERVQIVTAAEQAWEDAHYASAEDDVDLWKELFGPRFRVEDAA